MSIEWWKSGVFYQIYPRSFADSNGDGVGDLPGITRTLAYLAGLGVDAVWLSPIYPSPMHDFGYDISDYRGVDPVFGGMADFDRFLQQAHENGIRVLMDLVVNHTSSLHPWFVESRSSRSSARRDWYIWRDGKRGRPPNNWRSVFAGRAWQWDPGTGQFYLHSFLKEQPDLNWRNPEVRNAVFDEIRFWLDRGVDGFRLDVVNLYVKDAQFRSNPFGIGRYPRPYDMQKHVYDCDRPELHGILRELRALMDSYPERTTVGEVLVKAPGNARIAASYLGDGTDELHMTFDFTLLNLPWDPARMFRQIEAWYACMPARGWPTIVFSNHDVPRSFSRYGRENRAEKARIVALLLLTLRGTPFIYYGEEIGMEDGRVARRELRDPVGLRYWPLNKGRDPARTPMQWTPGKNAGFTTGEPWLPIPSSHATCNAAREEQDPSSLLHFYKTLIRIRRENPCLSVGSWRALHRGDDGLIGFERTAGEARIAVLANLTEKRRTARFEGSIYRRVILSTRERGPGLAPGTIELRPFEGVMLAPISLL